MKYDLIFGFSGINRGSSSLLTADGELFDTSNLRTKKIGILKKTGDYSIENAQIVNNYGIIGGIDFYRDDESTHTHVVACNGASNADIYIDVTGTWTAQSQSLTKDTRVRFAYEPTLDTLFACNFSDATRSYNGTSWSTSTNVTSAPKAKIPFAFGRRMWLFNVDVDGTTYPTRGYRSSLVDSLSITWDTTNDWIVFDDVVKAVGRNGDNMIVFGENSAQIFTLADELYQVSNIGCIATDSVVWNKNFTFRATRDGFYATDGSDDTKISLQIQDFWDAIPEANLSEIRAQILNGYIYVYIGDVTVSGVNYSNVMFEYDIEQNDWNKMELGVEVEEMHTFVTSSGKKLFIGDDDGNIFEMFDSETQNTSEFRSSGETNWFYGSANNNQDEFYELWGYGNKLSGLRVSYKIDSDDNDWNSVGELNGTIDVVKFKATGYRIKFFLEEISKENMYELEGLEIGWLPKYTLDKKGDS